MLALLAFVVIAFTSTLEFSENWVRTAFPESSTRFAAWDCDIKEFPEASSTNISPRE